MRNLLVPTFIVLSLAACSSTPTKDNSVPVQTTTGAVEQQPVQQVKKDETPQPRVDKINPRKALTDPNNILSKRSVYFDLDKYDIKSQFQPLVEAHGKFLSAYDEEKVLIQGNADERGSREYNLALGQKRAEAVKQSMILLGAKEKQIEAVSLGKERPKAEGHNETAWAENRRSDILYDGEF